MKPIYLDCAAATPLDERVFAAMRPYYEELYFNPSASYAAAVQVRRDVDDARGCIARILGCRPSEIVFTAGGTEANNLAIKGVMNQLSKTYQNVKIAYSSIEHDSVIEAARMYDHDVLKVDEGGIVDLSLLESAIDDQTGMVSIMYVNNEIGSIQPINKISQLLDMIRRDRRTRGVNMPLLFHTDAAQAGNHLDLHVARLGVDLLTINGGKIYGPKQSGLLYVKGGTQLEPLITGGGQERGARSGTENVPAIIGISKALIEAQNMRHEESRRLSILQDYWLQKSAKLLPDATINGSIKHRLPNNIHVTLAGYDNERLLYMLDDRGIMAAAGSACSASREESSHVLRAIGLTVDQVHSSLRFTMGRMTTQPDVEKVISTLAQLTNNK